VKKIALACATIGCIVAVVPVAASGFEVTFQNRSITTSDLTFTGARLSQNGTASTCDANKPFPGTAGAAATRHFDVLSSANQGTTPACIQVHLAGACGANTNITSAGYTGAFVPPSVQTNYLGDPGTSIGANATLDYAFLAPPGTFQMIVYELTPDTGCASYSLRVRVSPSTDTADATNVGHSFATLNGTAALEGEPGTTGHFQFGTTIPYDSATTPATIPSTGQTNDPFSASITGLAPDTTYHYRSVVDFPAFASGPAGTAVGPDRTFTTPGFPTLTTGAATQVTSTSATLNGTVNPHGLGTIASFEYGKTSAFGSTATTPAAQDVGADRSDHAVSLVAAGLEPATTYHYRMVAKQGGTTVTGADRTFTTAAVPPPPAPPSGGTGTGGGSTSGGGSSGTGNTAAAPAPIPLVTATVDTVAPRFDRAPKVTVRHRRATFAYTLSEPAAVTITLRRTVATSARRRVVRAGTLHQAGKAGPNKLTRRLKRGAYTLTATARDVSGNVSSALRARFRVR
jgi:hypothetical protein